MTKHWVALMAVVGVVACTHEEGSVPEGDSFIIAQHDTHD